MIDKRILGRLALAGAVSGVLHAAVIALGRIDAPPPPGEWPPLAARIVSVPPATSLDAAAEGSLVPRKSTRAVGARTSRVATVTAPSSIAAAVEAEASEVAMVEEPQAEETPAAVAPTEPSVIATAPPSTYVPEPEAVRSLPRKGRITYNLVYGRDQFPVGRTVQTWEMDGAHYRLASRSETTGVVDLIRSQHRTFLSRGSVTRDGLRPETFLMSRNRGRGTEEARAKFDWDGATVILGAAAGERKESLPPKTQDLLSMMYQLSLAPPRPGRFRQTVTNGARIETYELEAMPEETIQTPIGDLRALPIKQIRNAGEESLELWLATEYRHLPVRIRFFSREGEPQGEQLVTEIRLSDE